MNAAEDYYIAYKIRAYIAAVETSGNLDEEKLESVEWAKQKADWNDPTVARGDEFFGKRKHEEDVRYKEVKEFISYGSISTGD